MEEKCYRVLFNYKKGYKKYDDSYTLVKAENPQQIEDIVECAVMMWGRNVNSVNILKIEEINMKEYNNYGIEIKEYEGEDFITSEYVEILAKTGLEARLLAIDTVTLDRDCTAVSMEIIKLDTVSYMA